MVYRPVPSDTATRLPSISAGLAASTVTPGRTPPVLSLTSPVIELWASAAAGSRARQENAANAPRVNLTAVIFPPRGCGCANVDISTMNACDPTERSTDDDNEYGRRRTMRSRQA